MISDVSESAAHLKALGVSLACLDWLTERALIFGILPHEIMVGIFERAWVHLVDGQIYGRD